MKPLKKFPHLALLDDDPTFCALVAAAAKKQKIPVTVCATVAELHRALQREKVDVAVIDYYLGDVHGTEVAGIAKDIPVLLTSHTGKWLHEGGDWLPHIERFIHKNGGVSALLEEVVRVANQDRPRLSLLTSGLERDKPYY